jgi:DNA polymerase III delta prime subunit
MHAFIVYGGTLESRADFISEKNTATTELIHLFAEKSSITIKQVQDLSVPLSISPRLPRIVWIEEANLLTVPAQNALLKMLEEPPTDTTFYLTCATHTALLPTVRSRSSVINLTLDQHAQDPTTLSDLKAIMALTPGDRLAAIVKRDRTESIAWIGEIEFALRDKLKDPNLTASNLKMLAKIASLALSTHAALLANCSVSLTTQHFYLSLPHTK